MRGALARVLREAFAAGSGFYASDEEASAEVACFARPGWRVWVALGEGDEALGWIGAITDNALVWELHPLAVLPSAQGRGVGRALVGALEDAARVSGANAVYTGTEDETGATTLFGVDPYPDIAGALASVRVVKDHPIAFYQRMGYTLVGLIPHAVGPGKHDFFLCKRVHAEGAG